MMIKKVIDRADAFYPNHFTLDEKLDWCYELSCILRSQIKKIYKSITSTSNECVLPPDVQAEDIVSLQVNKAPYEKINMTDVEFINAPEKFTVSTNSDNGVRIVYLTKPEKYNTFIQQGWTLCNTNRLSLDEMAKVDILEPGDTLIMFFEDSRIVFNMITEIDKQRKTAVMMEDFKENGNFDNVIIKRMVNDSTECGAPHDAMYIDWLLGKFAFYQNDFEAYNQQMALFNSKLDLYSKAYKQTNPTSIKTKFHSFW